MINVVCVHKKILLYKDKYFEKKKKIKINTHPVSLPLIKLQSVTAGLGDAHIIINLHEPMNILYATIICHLHGQVNTRILQYYTASVLV